MYLCGLSFFEIQNTFYTILFMLRSGPKGVTFAPDILRKNPKKCEARKTLLKQQLVKLAQTSTITYFVYET